MQKKPSLYQIVTVGMLTAMVFVANFLSIPLGDVSRIHFGNAFCALAGLLLGPISGGLSAGLGGFFFDLMNPLYAAEAPITFLTKFVLGAVTGWVAHAGGARGEKFHRNLLAALLGSLSYVVVYLGKSFVQQYYLLKNPLETVLVKLSIKGVASLTNAVIAVMVALVLLPVFQKVMKSTGISERLFPKTK